jgi:phage baseplate assembly protein V
VESPTPQHESPYELTRRLEGLARIGTVTEVRTERPARCRVAIGENTTDWLPWLERRAGGRRGGRTWWPPVQGEQCLVIAPGGDLRAGVVLPGIYSDAMDAPSEDAGCERTEWDEGNSQEWLAGNYLLRVSTSIRLQVGNNTFLELTDGGITLRVGGQTLTLSPSSIEAHPDILGGGRVSLVNHVHVGVETGPGITGVPL